MNTCTRKAKALLLAIGIGAMPLVTAASCDPVTGMFRFFRDTDNYYDDGYYYDDYYYGGYYGGYYDDYYYEDYYYDDCYYCY